MAIFRRGQDPAPPGLGPYLLQNERIVAAVHQHWGKIAEPVASTILALAVALAVDANLTPKTQGLGTLVWLFFLAVLARLLWRILEWRHDWFVATDKRLLLRHGLVTHKVSMMPLLKVTDMSYVRSIPGQLFGYGTFVMESAGQEQAMRTVKWVPQPDETYRAICSVIFHVPSAPKPEDPTVGEEVVVESETIEPVPPLEPRMAYPDVHPIHNPVQDRLDSYSRPMPIRRRSVRKTGPIPVDPGDD
jgi:hypothetical protein